MKNAEYKNILLFSDELLHIIIFQYLEMQIYLFHIE